MSLHDIVSEKKEERTTILSRVLHRGHKRSPASQSMRKDRMNEDLLVEYRLPPPEELFP